MLANVITNPVQLAQCEGTLAIWNMRLYEQKRCLFEVLSEWFLMVRLWLISAETHYHDKALPYVMSQRYEAWLIWLISSGVRVKQ